MLPCLVTELVLAAGFLTLVAVRMTAVIQFAILTAIAMLLAWLANALVLPLVLRALVRRAPPPRPAPRPIQLAGDVAGWMARQSIEHPRRILAGAALVLALAALFASRVRIEYRVFDDLRPGSDIAAEIARAEAAVGGLVPVAIHVEAAAPGGALDPAAIRLAERAAAYLRSFPEIRQANSLADFLRPVQALVAGDEPGTGSRSLRRGRRSSSPRWATRARRSTSSRRIGARSRRWGARSTWVSGGPGRSSPPPSAGWRESGRRWRRPVTPGSGSR